MIVIASLSACSPAVRFLLYIDPYVIEVLEGQGIAASEIRQSLSKDLNVRVEASALLVEETEALRRFDELIERTNPDWVYLSPAHPFDPGAVIPRYPDVRFFREGNAGEGFAGENPGNQIALVYDRERANYEAGGAIALLLGDTEFLEQIGAAGPVAGSPRVGILAAVLTEPVKREIAAFEEGFSQLADPKAISVKEIGNLTDRVKARRLLEGMREETVAIVLLKTYVLSGFCLDYLSKEGGVAVVEGPISDQAYGETVLLMLVDDFLGSLEQMAQYIDQESPAGTDGLVSAPVQLRWNQAYRSVVNTVIKGVDQQ